MAKSIKENLISEFGLDKLPQEKKVELVIKWGDIVQRNIIIRILQELPEADKTELDELLAEKGENFEEIYKFLEGKMPNLENIVKEEIEKFAKEMKSTIKELDI